MTIREFFRKVVDGGFDMDMELTVEIKGARIASGFVDVYTDMNTVVLTQYAEEPQEVDFNDNDIDMIEYDEFFHNLSEALDSAKINGVC